jgi:hypothetical protein
MNQLQELVRFYAGYVRSSLANIEFTANDDLKANVTLKKTKIVIFF